MLIQRVDSSMQWRLMLLPQPGHITLRHQVQSSVARFGCSSRCPPEPPTVASGLLLSGRRRHRCRRRRCRRLHPRCLKKAAVASLKKAAVFLRRCVASSPVLPPQPRTCGRVLWARETKTTNKHKKHENKKKVRGGGGGLTNDNTPPRAHCQHRVEARREEHAKVCDMSSSGWLEKQ